MDIAFITDPLESFKIYKDSTFAMMQEAARRGHRLFVCGPEDLAWEGGAVVAQLAALQLTGETEWYRLTSPVPRALDASMVVLQRKDPPFDMEYLYATYLLELAEQKGARVFNRPAALRNHNEKLSIAQFPQWTAPTLVARDMARLKAFHACHGDVIFKPLDGMGGMGIFRVREDGMNLGSILETLTADGQCTIMAQRYLPAIAEGDKRILLIGGVAVPYALARIPAANEVRGNLAAGGRGVAQALSARDAEIAAGLGPELYRRGLLLVGLDVIGDCLTEINVTSPTCFQEITQQTGVPVASLFIDALERAVQ